MDLSQFVSETLSQIIEGTVTAQESARARNAYVNPARLPSAGIEVFGAGFRRQDVVFDVAVTASESTEKEGGAKIAVWGVGVGGSGKRESENQTVSRIRFAVTIALPPQKWS